MATMLKRSLSTLRNAVKPTVAIVGATGAVGHELVACLKQRDFPLDSLRLLSSSRSAGKTVQYKDPQTGAVLHEGTVEEATPDAFRGVDIALFSAGGGISKALAPAAVQAGAVVVDNSSAFRMDPSVPLVVPEVNPDDAAAHQGIIANPNCSTIIMNVAVYPVHKNIGPVQRVAVSTYQAASGAGAAAMAELEGQAHAWSKGTPLPQDIFGRQYIWNLFSHNSGIDPNTLYNEEEMKMINETRKIFHDDSIGVTATCIRVPVLRAHCESINITFKDSVRSDVSRQDILDVLAAAPGVTIVDDPATNQFPEPIHASGKDDVLVGRVRPDLSQAPGTGFEMFVAGDQLLKGAALNAVQIAELLLQRS